MAGHASFLEAASTTKLVIETVNEDGAYVELERTYVDFLSDKTGVSTLIELFGTYIAAGIQRRTGCC